MNKNLIKSAVAALMLAIATPSFAQLNLNKAKLIKSGAKAVQALTITNEQMAV